MSFNDFLDQKEARLSFRQSENISAHQLHPVITLPFSPVQIISSGGGKAKLQASNHPVRTTQWCHWHPEFLLDREKASSHGVPRSALSARPKCLWTTRQTGGLYHSGRGHFPLRSQTPAFKPSFQKTTVMSSTDTSIRHKDNVECISF